MEIEVKQVEWFDDRFYKIVYEKPDKTVVTDYFPSVTTKLGAVAKPFLARWRGDVGNREADLRMSEGADRGTRTHFAWQMLTTGGAVVYNNPMRPSVSPEEIKALAEKFSGKIYVLQNQNEMYDLCKLRKFLEILKPRLQRSEFTVYDLETRDAGTLDNTFEIDEGTYQIAGATPIHLESGLYVFDLKTGVSVGKEARMQVAEYSICHEKMGLGNIKGAIIGHTQASTKKGIEGFTCIVLNRDEIQEEWESFRHVAAIWEKMFGTLKPDIFEIPNILTLEVK